jgi:hypothetical protein
MAKGKNKKKVSSLINHDESINRSTLWFLLGGISLTSFSLIGFEITLSRLLSVLLSYHYVFAVLSLALLGLGLGGMFLHFFRPKRPVGENRFAGFAFFSSMLSLVIPFSAILIIQIGYIDNIQMSMLLYGVFLLVPFFLAGVLFAEVYRIFPGVSPSVYGADLIGAGAGSFGAILFINLLGGIRASLLLGVVASMSVFLFTIGGSRKNRKRWIPSLGSFLILSFLLGVNLIGFYSPDIPVGINPSKEIHDVLYGKSSNGKIVETRWSAFGRTDLVAFGNHSDHMDLYIDGTAGSPMYRFNGDLTNPDSAIDSLKNTFPGYFPFLFLKEGEKDNALMIGPGGGRDILLALMAGFQRITAVEINGDLVDLVRDFSAYNGGIYTRFDNVRIDVDEGRSFLKRQREKYDLIMLSLPVTNTSRSLEGYALSESFLFTTDSIRDYLGHLTDEGQLVVVGHNDAETLRLLSLSLSVLNKSGLTTASAMTHIYILGSELYPVFVLRRKAFEPGEILTRYKAMDQFGLDPGLSYFPYVRQKGALNPALMALGRGEIDLDTLVKMVREKGFDIRPITDDNPFFYKIEKGLPRPVFLALVASIIVLLFTISAPSIPWRKSLNRKGVFPEYDKKFNRTKIQSIVLFSMLGFGFMLIEISLIQRFALFLGHPVLSMALLLFGLLGSAGLGSMLSGRLASNKINLMISVTSLSAVILLLGYIFFLPLVFERLLGWNLTLRLLFTVLMLSPLGLSVGFPFPLGLKGLRKMGMETYIPWMWGVNGASSVLGSVIAIVVAIRFGFTPVLLLSAFCYFIIFLIFLRSDH